MAEREVIWTKHAQNQLQKILDFYTHRNQSSQYSLKLYKKFKTELIHVALKPEIGIKTKLQNIRGLVTGDYIIFYEILETKILVLKIWDCRQNPGKLEIPR